MPPEQARGQKELDERADIYALGVILFELLSAQKPHSGENYNAILYSILMQAAPRIESYRPDLPPELAAIVHRAMAADANERHQSVSELSEALAPFAGRSLTPSPMSHASSALFPQGPMPRSTSTRAPVAVTPPTPTTYEGPPPTSRAGLWVGLGVVALALVSVTGFLLTRTTPVEPTAASGAPSLSTLPPLPVTAAATPSAAPMIEIAAAPTPLPTVAAPVATPTATVSPRRNSAPKPLKLQPQSAHQPSSAVAPPAPVPVKPAAPRPKPDDDLFAP
jgi:serine/threonine-protein kinase